MAESITCLMKQEHNRILEILNIFENHADEKVKEKQGFFNTLKWNLEKHMFVEEKAIISLYQSIVNEEVSDVFDILQEHGEINNLLNEIEKKLKRNEKPITNELKQLLTEHVEFETSSFYPMLDEKLNEFQKDFIINRVNEIIKE